eukprot:3520565-Alexandrium_andersonii.AAC.1
MEVVARLTVAVGPGEAGVPSALKVADCQLDVLPAGASMACRLPSRQHGLNERSDGADCDGLDQPAQVCGQHEWPLPFRPRVVALLGNPDQ